MKEQNIDLKSLRQAQERALSEAASSARTYAPSNTGSPISDSLYGINNDLSPLAVPINKTHYGYV
ncbi:hypothetical protein ACYT69_13235, partial [Streptococcus pyogenes]